METYEYWAEKYPKFKSNPYNDGVDIVIGDWSVMFFKTDPDYNDRVMHRLDGPARIGKDGQSFWFINDSAVACRFRGSGPWSGKLYEWSVENEIDLNNLREEDIALIKLFWYNHGNV